VISSTCDQASKAETPVAGAVLILPWIQIEKPITIGDVVFYPFDDALSIAGKHREDVEAYGSIYVDPYFLGLAVQYRKPVPKLKPTIAFVAEDDELSQHANDAANVLMLSTIFENQSVHANGATFARIIRGLDEGGGVEIIPRMHGRTLNLIGFKTHLQTRPRHTGDFHHLREPEMVNALWNAMTGSSASSYRVILETLRTATSESPDVSWDLAESLMAKAATLLVQEGSVPDERLALSQNLKLLLAPFIDQSTNDEYGYHIARVWQAVRDRRNGFWHPKLRASKDFPFAQQTLIAPLVIALRMVQAVFVARLVNGGYAPADSSLVANVMAAERWFETLNPDLEISPEGLSYFEFVMARRERSEKAENAFWELRSQSRFQLAVARHMADHPEPPP
jgi:hypothetical protein